MDVESRDSVSLKPAELDELGQLFADVGLPLHDEQLDRHVEQFPLIAIAVEESELHGFLFGSLERIGGTPCILWGLGAVRRGRQARTSLDGLVAELYRRAAISFPDEDVLVAGRIAHPAAYSLLGVLDRRLPAAEVHAQRRGAGLGSSPGAAVRLRRPLRRPRVPARRRTACPSSCSTPRAVKGGGKVATELIGDRRPGQRRSRDRVRLGDGRGPRRRPQLSLTLPPRRFWRQEMVDMTHA